MKNLFRQIVLSTVLSAATAAAAAPAIEWQPWSDAVFERARSENRFVLLDLEAVWCHWCHVMDQETYSDPEVQELIAQHYIAIRVDQDARPDLSRRYEDYGWPATIVFGPDGKEIVKRSGFIAAKPFNRLLGAILDDPSPVKYRDSEPVTQFSVSPLLPDELRATLKKQIVDSHDFKAGGLLQQQKFMDRDTVEYALEMARAGDSQSRRMATQTLDGALNLIDPVWGGVYQYSTNGDWKHPHFEKIMFVQADTMRVYALASLQLNDARYLNAARDIYRYVNAFLLSPEGAYYVSQDADLVRGQHSQDYFALNDAKRRARGIPAIDKHLYARENGWMMQGLAALYAADGNPQILARAVAAARWVLDNRSLPGGGFRHDEADAAGPYLEDTLAAGRGFLALYQVTGQREWLRHAQAAAGFMRANFTSGSAAGFVTTVPGKGAFVPMPQTDENIMLARFANLLSRYTGDPTYRDDAERAMRFLVTREVALKRRTEAGLLIADRELSNDPVHLTVVGAKGDLVAKELFRIAQRQAGTYKRIEWWDRSEGPMPNPDVQYPDLPKSAAYVCSQNRCSLPVFEGKALIALAERLAK